MRMVLTALALVMATTASHAINRYNIGGKSCSEVQSILQREGAAVLRYTTKRGVTRYDRYVSATRFCTGSDSARRASVPTTDNRNCPVKRCYVYSR